MAKLVIGCGYVGRRVARAWQAAGHPVYVTTRSPQRAEELRSAGLQPRVVDILQADTLADLPPADTVLFAVGYDRQSAYSIHALYVQGLEQTLTALSPAVDRLIYLSSTGVYGQQDGSWVDEQSPCQPSRPGGRACLAAEQLLQRHPQFAAKTIILRLAGIYGPARVPRIDTVRDQQPLAVPVEGYMNLIYVDDVVAAILAAERQIDPPALLSISDGQPVKRRDFYDEIGRQLNLPVQYIPPTPGDASVARAQSNKRIANDRMLNTLHLALQYPSYREGLAKILRSQGTPQNRGRGG